MLAVGAHQMLRVTYSFASIVTSQLHIRHSSATGDDRACCDTAVVHWNLWTAVVLTATVKHCQAQIIADRRVEILGLSLLAYVRISDPQIIDS